MSCMDQVRGRSTGHWQHGSSWQEQQLSIISITLDKGERPEITLKVL